MDRIGLRGVPEHQGRATDEVDGERLALERALELQFGLGLGAGLALRRRYRAVERELALGVMVGKTPVGDLEMPDQRHLVRSLGAAALARPVVTGLSPRLQFNCSLSPTSTATSGLRNTRLGRTMSPLSSGHSRMSKSISSAFRMCLALPPSALATSTLARWTCAVAPQVIVTLAICVLRPE